MRKFTKEISMLIAAVTAGTMSGTTINAVTEADVAEMENNTYEIQRTAGVAQMEDPEEMQPTAGVPLLPDECLNDGCEEILPTIGEEALPDYTEPEGTPIKLMGEATVPDYTEPEENVMQMQGQATVPDYTEPEVEPEPLMGDVAPDYTEPEPEPEPLMGDVAPDYTESTENLEPVMGGFPEPDYTEPEETLPPEDGVAMMPDYTEPEDPWDEPMMGVMPPVITGDANEDGQCDLTDLSTTALHLVGDLEMSYSAKENADMDKDGDVDIADLATMRQILSKKDNNKK